MDTALAVFFAHTDVELEFFLLPIHSHILLQLFTLFESATLIHLYLELGIILLLEVVKLLLASFLFQAEALD